MWLSATTRLLVVLGCVVTSGMHIHVYRGPYTYMYNEQSVQFMLVKRPLNNCLKSTIRKINIYLLNIIIFICIYLPQF